MQCYPFTVQFFLVLSMTPCLHTMAVQSTGIRRMLSESPGPSPGVKCAVYDCCVADCEQLTSDSSYDAAV